MTREELSHYEVMLLSQGITGIQKAIHMEIAYNLYLSELQSTIEAQEIIIKDKSAIMEAMSQPKSEFIDTSCMRCKNVNDCSLCENVKNETGMKLREMSFFCFEPKAQP